ncbi:CBS domain-containing protein [Acidocella sp.]|uniref:CBS domain-containing protein n=1 Tax=Acidocella sp. TaxID=50710 RepID=UPI003D083E4E
MITANIMTDAVTVAPGASLAEAARVMLARNAGSLQVVDEAGQLLGILTESDLLRQAALESHDGQHVCWLKAFLAAAPLVVDYSPAHGRKVSDVMTLNPTSLGPEDTLAEAAKTMRRLNVKRLPVVDEGTLVGLLSIGDLLAALTNGHPAPQALA